MFGLWGGVDSFPNGGRGLTTNALYPMPSLRGMLQGYQTAEQIKQHEEHLLKEHAGV